MLRLDSSEGRWNQESFAPVLAIQVTPAIGPSALITAVLTTRIVPVSFSRRRPLCAAQASFLTANLSDAQQFQSTSLRPRTSCQS